jgi:ubiquinone biosynthesis protein
VRRLARIARFGARVPGGAEICEAFQSWARRRSSSARRWRPGPTSSGARRRTTSSCCRTTFPRRRSSRSGRDRAGLEKPLEHVFREIDPEPVGAASIAQVHRAITTEGHLVAVKVLRPNIEEDFARALDTYQWAAAQMERMGGEVTRLRPRA